MDKKPVVSVWITTYNQVDYIAQTLDSVLMQKVDFTYDIVVGDDDSNDGTREILLAYQKKHPDTIKLLLQEHNRGIIQNSADTYKLCTGKYIACLDGDDYWTDVNKLQKQYDLLEAHEDVVLLANDVIEHHLDGSGKVTKEKVMGESLQEGYLEPYDIFTMVIVINTLGIMFRNHHPSEFLEKYVDDLVMPDIAVWLYISQFGKIYFKKEVVAVYRQHTIGYSRVMDEKQIHRFLKQYNVFDNVFDDKGIKKRVRELSAYRYYALSVIYKTEKKYVKMFASLWDILTISPKVFVNYILLKDYT